MLLDVPYEIISPSLQISSFRLKSDPPDHYKLYYIVMNLNDIIMDSTV
jgi:hypothetical protein